MTIPLMSLSSDQNKPIRYAVLILHVGSPADMGWIEMWNFLRRKLSDRRLIYPIPGWLWAPFLHLFVLPWRVIHTQMAQNDIKKDLLSDSPTSSHALGVDGVTTPSTQLQETKDVPEFSSLLPTPRTSISVSATVTVSSDPSLRPSPPPLLSPLEKTSASYSEAQKEATPSLSPKEQDAVDEKNRYKQTDKGDNTKAERSRRTSLLSNSPRNTKSQASLFPTSSVVPPVGAGNGSDAFTDRGAGTNRTSAPQKRSSSSVDYIRRLCALLQQHFRSPPFEARHPQEAVQVRCAFSYQPNSIEKALQQFQLLGDYSGVVDTNGHRARVREEQLLILPLFPQYRAGLTPSLLDAVLQSSLFKPSIRKVPTFHFRSSYCAHPRYIQCLERHLQCCFSETGVPYWLFIVFPSALKSFMVKDTDNVYMMECCRTFAALRQLLARPSVPSPPVKSSLFHPSWNSTSCLSDVSKSIPFSVRMPTSSTPPMSRSSGLNSASTLHPSFPPPASEEAVGNDVLRTSRSVTPRSAEDGKVLLIPFRSAGSGGSTQEVIPTTTTTHLEHSSLGHSSRLRVTGGAVLTKQKRETSTMPSAEISVVRPSPTALGTAEDSKPEEETTRPSPPVLEAAARDGLSLLSPPCPSPTPHPSSFAVEPFSEGNTAPLPQTTFASIDTRSTVIPPLSFTHSSVSSSSASLLPPGELRTSRDSPDVLSSSRVVLFPPSSSRMAYREMGGPSAFPPTSLVDGESGLSAPMSELPPFAEDLVFPANRIKLIFLPFQSGKGGSGEEGNEGNTVMVSSLNHTTTFHGGGERKEEDYAGTAQSSSARSSCSTFAPSSAPTAAPPTPPLPLHLRFHPNTVLAEAYEAEKKINALEGWTMNGDEDDERKRGKAEGLESLFSSRSSKWPTNVQAAYRNTSIPYGSTALPVPLVSPTSQCSSRSKCASHKVCIFCPGNAVEDEMTYLTIKRHLIPKCKRYWNQVEYIPALNDSPLHVNLLADLLSEYMIK